MKINYTHLLIAAAALVLPALIAIQVSWMRHSRQLLEEQFNNRVNMALCSTVEELANSPAGSGQVKACCMTEEGRSKGCAKTLDELRQMPEMRSALTNNLQFYKVELPHKVLITEKDTNGDCTKNPPFSCSLTPILENDTHVLQLQFENKEDYIAAKMGMMTGASVALLTLVCLLFGLAALYMLRQKRMGDLNRDFFNHMTHEFRTPLTNIRLAGNMLARKNPELSDNKYLNIIQKECVQLTGQVENVLHLAAFEKGDYQVQKESVDVKKVLDNTLEQMEMQIRDRSATVEVSDLSGALTMKADPFHLGNAFRNLIDNALKYTQSNPVIKIGLQRATEGIQLSFADNGVGMNEEEQSRMFQKFQRCHTDCLPATKGFGLGLAYVKKIMELHGGRINVSSAEGRGTRFDLFLPA